MLAHHSPIPDPMGIESCQKAGSRGAAATRIVELCEPQAFGRQPIQYGRFDLAPEASRIGKTEVIGQDDDNVGRRLNVPGRCPVPAAVNTTGRKRIRGFMAGA